MSRGEGPGNSGSDLGEQLESGVRPLDDLFDALARSAFRRRFHVGPAEREYIAKRGLERVLVEAEELIGRRLAPASPPNDGRQTPFRGHPVFVAQHATATCCRGCLAKWHDIPRGEALTDEQQAHVVATIDRWLRSELAEDVPYATGAMLPDRTGGEPPHGRQTP
jgi:predicted Fe-S protein YdhL (DUF1289 family)